MVWKVRLCEEKGYKAMNLKSVRREGNSRWCEGQGSEGERKVDKTCANSNIFLTTGFYIKQGGGR